MAFLSSLFQSDSVAHSILIISLICATGLLLGNIRFWKIKLGLAGALFSGLVFGHFHLSVNDQILDFTRDFGLILFVYAIGLQVGPGFFASLRKQGLRLNILAGLVVLLGVLTTLLIQIWGHIPGLLSVGLYSGGTTNSPSLGAVQQILKDIPHLSDDQQGMPGLGLALSYPFGILGTILAMILTRLIFRIDIKMELEALEQENAAIVAPVMTMNVEVKNPNLVGKMLQEIPGWAHSGIVVSRLWDGQNLHLAKPTSVLQAGTVLLAIGPKEKLNEFQIIVGVSSDMDLRTIPSDITTERVVVTKKGAVGKTLQSFDMLNRFGVTLTRVMRGGQVLTANPSLKLQFGDTVLMVGASEAIEEAAKDLGNSPHHLNLPQILPLFVGIALGVIVGTIPFQIPGLPAPVRLGMAGGPLIVAMILARIGKIGPAVWYLPVSSNFMLRDFGLILFLAAVGLRAGDPFFRALAHGSGWFWMASAALVTLIPLLLGAIIARVRYKVNYLSICGFLAGSMNSPTLAFANSLAHSDAPAIAFATVYPLVMLLRILTAQILVLFFLR
jgi:putative transport protein